MATNIMGDPINLKENCKVETLLDKIRKAIDSYHYGLLPAEYLACKMQEYANKLSHEVNNV